MQNKTLVQEIEKFTSENSKNANKILHKKEIKYYT